MRNDVTGGTALSHRKWRHPNANDNRRPTSPPSSPCPGCSNPLAPGNSAASPRKGTATIQLRISNASRCHHTSGYTFQSLFSFFGPFTAPEKHLRAATWRRGANWNSGCEGKGHPARRAHPEKRNRIMGSFPCSARGSHAIMPSKKEGKGKKVRSSSDYQEMSLHLPAHIGADSRSARPTWEKLRLLDCSRSRRSPQLGG